MHAGGDVVDMKAEQYHGDEAVQLHQYATTKKAAKKMITGAGGEDEPPESNFLTLLYEWEEVHSFEFQIISL